MNSFSLLVSNRRISSAIKHVMSRNRNVREIQSLKKIILQSKSRDGIVGLTEYDTSTGKQSIKLYKSILLSMPEEAIIGVIAHEFAHAWLNENVFPSASKRREAEANRLASRWGFAKEIKSLERYSKGLHL